MAQPTIPKHAQRFVGKPGTTVRPDSAEYAIPWYNPDDKFKLTLRLFDGSDVAVGADLDLREEDLVYQRGDARLNQVRIQGLFLSAMPPVDSTPNPVDFVLGLNGADPAGDRGAKAFPVSAFGLRYVAQGPTRATDPSTAGDIAVDKANRRVDIGLPMPDGKNWIRIPGVILDFELPTGLPSAPVLSARVTEGGQIGLSWTHPGFGDTPTTTTTTVRKNRRKRIMYNIAFEGNPRQWMLDHLQGKPVHGVCLLLRWRELQPTPTTWNLDYVTAALELCRQWGWKAQLFVLMVRERNANGQPQDHEAFFPESAIVRYQDGAYYKQQEVLGRADVVGSPSSAEAVASMKAFWAGLCQRLKPYSDDGTLMSVFPGYGGGGEFNYPYDPGTGQLGDYCQAALTNFRTQYLPTQYDSIAALNADWGTSYPSFSAVAWPVQTPTGSGHYFSIDTTPERHWFRWRIRVFGLMLNAMQEGVRGVSDVPFLVIFADMGRNFQFTEGIGTSNVAFLARNVDGIYTSGGGGGTGDFENGKLIGPDLIMGTIGDDRIAEIEFDGGDLTDPYPSWFNQAAQFPGFCERFFAKGGDTVHLVPVGSEGGWPWGVMEPYVRQVYEAIGGAASSPLTPRAPAAAVTYTFSDMLGPNQDAHIDAWRAALGPSRQVALRQLDDFTGAVLPPVGGVVADTGTGFELFRSLGDEASYALLDRPGPQERAYTQPGSLLSQHLAVYYRMRAYNRQGASGLSNQVQLSKELPGVEGRIVLQFLGIDGATTTGPGGPIAYYCTQLRWQHFNLPADVENLWFDAVAAADPFPVGTGGSEYWELDSIGANNCTYAQPGGSYKIRMRAISPSKGEILSNVISFTLDAQGNLLGQPGTLVHALTQGAVETVRCQLVRQPNGMFRVRETLLNFTVPAGYDLYRIVNDYENGWAGSLEDYGEWPEGYDLHIIWVVAKGRDGWRYKGTDPAYVLQTAALQLNTGY